MKKLTSIIFCLIFLVSCSGSSSNTSSNIRKYYNQLETFTINADITSKLSTRQMDFSTQYTYYNNAPDTGIITHPKEISGISFNVSDIITFDDNILEMAIKDIPGGTPIDMIYAVINDIKNEYPKETDDGKNSITLVYENEVLRKSVVINKQNFTLISAEVFSDGKQILEAKFSI